MNPLRVAFVSPMGAACSRWRCGPVRCPVRYRWSTSRRSSWPLFALPIERLGARTAGITSGFGNFCANLGGFAFSYVLGAVKDATGSFRIGFMTLATMCALALLVTLSLRTTTRKEPLAGALSR